MVNYARNQIPIPLDLQVETITDLVSYLVENVMEWV